MAWTAPRTWVTGETLTSTLLNTHLRDNLISLREQYVTAPPASPNDGDRCVLVDSLTAPTYQWALRYNASSTNTDKWEFVGGAAARNSSDGGAGSAAGSGAYGSALGMAIVLPRGGVYEIKFGGLPSGNASGTTTVLGVGGGGAPASGDEITVNNSTIGSLALARRKTGVAATTSFDLYVKDNDSTRRVSFSLRWLEIVPVRLS